MNKTYSRQTPDSVLMDEVEEMLLSNCVMQGMSHLVEGLKQIRSNYSSEEWLAFSKNGFREHSLAQIIYQDPFTKHSYEKPRGYAGDADLIDYIYGFRFPPKDSTVLGQEIFNYTTGTGMAQSIIARRDILAETIDRVAYSSSNPIGVLSIACGHLREVKKSKAFYAGMIEKFIALDRDIQSLERINKELSGYAVKTIQNSVTAIIRGKNNFENLDLVYATGLYDYLSQALATRLTKNIFDMLGSGGKMLVANLVPNHWAIGYMETFMQWDLVYRSEKQLEAVANEIPAPLIANKRTFFDNLENVVFLEVVRA